MGVCLVVALFHLNLRVFGSGLEEIRFQFVATLALIVSYFLNYKELNEDPAPMRPPMKLLLAYLGIIFLTSVWAAASPALAFDSAVEFAKIVLFAWLMTKVIKTETEVRILAYVVFVGAWYVSFMAQWGVEWDWIDEVDVGVATGGTGAHLMMYMPLMILLVLYGKWKERIAVGLIIPFVLNFLPNTPSGSRATLVMLVTSMAFLFVFAPGSMRLKAIGPMIAAGLLFTFYLTPPGYWEDMATILHPQEEGSAASRFVINDASYQILKEYPMGIGYNNYPLISMKYLPEETLTDLGTRDAHNSYLKVLTEFGVVGFAIWIITFFVTWLYFRRVRKTMIHGEKPTTLQLYALAFELGLIGITVGIWTHSYNDLDTLYWFVAFSCILFNLQEKNAEGTSTKEAEPAPAGRMLPNANRLRKPAGKAIAASSG